MNFKVELITPEIARNYLAASEGNRPLRRRDVEKYIDQMQAGKWQITSDAIAFDEDGVLKNGHHRLTAISESGVPVLALVAYGLPKNTTEYDTGYNRNIVQRLRYNHNLSAELSTNNVAAMAKIHFEFLVGIAKAKSITSETMAQFISANQEDILDSISLCNRAANKKFLLQRASFSYSIFCALKCGVEMSALDEFCHIVSTGFYTSDAQTAAIVIRNCLFNGFDFKTKTAGDSLSRHREARVIQAGIDDFIHEKVRKRSYDPEKCKAVFTQNYLRTLGVG